MTADGGIGSGGRYCRRHLLSSAVEDVFEVGGAPLSSNRGHCCCGLVLSLHPSSLFGGAPPNPGSNNDDENDNKDDDNKDEDDNKDDKEDNVFSGSVWRQRSKAATGSYGNRRQWQWQAAVAVAAVFAAVVGAAGGYDGDRQL